MTLNLQELKPLFYLILHQLRLRLDYTASAVFFCEGEEYQPLEYPDEPEKQQIIKLYLLLLQSDDVQRRLDAQTPVMLEDVSDDTSILALLGEWLQEGLENVFVHTRSWIALPFSLSQPQLKGIICLSHTEPGRFSPNQLRFSQKIIEQAIQAHSRLYQRIQGTSVQGERQRMARELHD